jgi:hypothetical protein
LECVGYDFDQPLKNDVIIVLQATQGALSGHFAGFHYATPLVGEWLGVRKLNKKPLLTI